MPKRLYSIRGLLICIVLDLQSLPSAAAQVVRAGEAVSAIDGVGAGGIFQIGLSLVGVLALIGALAWLMRRVGRLNQFKGREVKILGGVSVTQRERLVLVQVGREQLLVGVAPGSIRTLHVLSNNNLLEADENEGAKEESFAGRLADALRQRIAT